MNIEKLREMADKSNTEEGRDLSDLLMIEIERLAWTGQYTYYPYFQVSNKTIKHLKEEGFKVLEGKDDRGITRELMISWKK